ncbi:TetR family transcriptional regulator [Streptomyces sp. NPDC051569]|uniref:TetR family transcriptional regulator n=1 Tax=Streptomyces sp. NPDC051569 TaxID=3365661 RepID=UPI0037A9FF17
MNAGEATKRRLLDAATAEFATYGIAGARVDRISAQARANKAQLYAYFGNKEGLFDAVFGEHLDMIVNTVPLNAEDLPGYATGLYDAYLVHPELVRLATWSRLERVPAGELITNLPGHDTLKLESISAAQRAGLVHPALAPTDVLTLVTAMSLAWSPASVTIAATKDDAEDEHERRRKALHETVRRAFAP